ncbi:TPA: hypothetical protein N0F65_010964 [Lagenidium giganteum]|uniref:Uncharacterized protein n=1 Tax=Lagenidium giganteum TaxID=4803 RepID=A0AAV2ZA31_9STRA|nr:TPA: hypothetical protein N0F65_010964 [Lagenidium giganteum]
MHIQSKFHLVCLIVEQGRLLATYCSNHEMAADIVTKSLARINFEKFRSSLGVIKRESVVQQSAEHQE